MKLYIKVVVFLFWTIASLYIGVGGYVALDIEKQVQVARLLPESQVLFKGIAFKNREALKAHKDELKAISFFSPLILNLPRALLYLLTAMAFGTIGAVTSISKKIAMEKMDIKNVPVHTTLLLGGLTGLLVLGIATLIPDLLLIGERDLNPLSLAFFSLLAGLSSEKFFGWLTKVNDKLFG